MIIVKRLNNDEQSNPAYMHAANLHYLISVSKKLVITKLSFFLMRYKSRRVLTNKMFDYHEFFGKAGVTSLSSF